MGVWIFMLIMDLLLPFTMIGFGAWLDGFEDTEKSVKGTVRAIMEHPLIPEDILVL